MFLYFPIQNQELFAIIQVQSAINIESPFEQWTKPSCLGYTWDYTTPSYVGIIINYYKDPYQTTSIMMESRRIFFQSSNKQVKAGEIKDMHCLYYD